MSDLPNLHKLEAGLLSSDSPNQQIEQLIITNRALHTVVFELKALLQSTAREDGIHSLGISQPPVIEASSEDKATSIAHMTAVGDFETPNTSAGATNEKTALTSTVEHSKADFEQDNEQARNRHEKRRQMEILRLKNRVSYKCK